MWANHDINYHWDCYMVAIDYLLWAARLLPDAHGVDGYRNVKSFVEACRHTYEEDILYQYFLKKLVLEDTDLQHFFLRIFFLFKWITNNPIFTYKYNDDSPLANEICSLVNLLVDKSIGVLFLCAKYNNLPIIKGCLVIVQKLIILIVYLLYIIKIYSHYYYYYYFIIIYST